MQLRVAYSFVLTKANIVWWMTWQFWTQQAKHPNCANKRCSQNTWGIIQNKRDVKETGHKWLHNLVFPMAIPLIYILPAIGQNKPVNTLGQALKQFFR